MLRKLNCFLNIVIGSFIGVFIGYTDGIKNVKLGALAYGFLS